MKQRFTRVGLVLAALLCLGGTSWAQSMIKGSVRTTSNEPLIGVSILVKGTTTGTVTDYDGNFELTSPAKEGTLVFSYTGYRAVEKTFSSSVNMLDVVMEEDIAKLDEVVVTGLASGVKRSNSGNAVTTFRGMS